MKLCFGSIGRMNPENLPTNSNCFLMGSGKSRETRCCLLLHNALQQSIGCVVDTVSGYMIRNSGVKNDGIF